MVRGRRDGGWKRVARRQVEVGLSLEDRSRILRGTESLGCEEDGSKIWE